MTTSAHRKEGKDSSIRKNNRTDEEFGRLGEFEYLFSSYVKYSYVQ